MSATTEQFITQMKFRELRVQRDTAAEAYGALRRELTAAPDDASKVRVLYRGLRAMRFAKQPLHPDVANLEPVLRDLERGDASGETVGFWRAELERELEQGQLRSRIVYVFGALLEEWATRGAVPALDDASARAQHAELLAQMAVEPADSDRAAFLESLFDELRLPSVEELRETARKAADEIVYAPMEHSARGNAELEAILDRLSGDSYRAGAIRAEARRYRQSPTLLKELSDALAILIDRIAEWGWDEGGVPAHTEWARNKWRLFLDEDLPIACLLETVGGRWQGAMDRILGGAPSERIRRVQRLHELGAPAIIMENERSLLAAYGAPEDADDDLWHKREEGQAPSTWGEPGSVALQRASLQGELHEFDRFDAYGEGGASSGLATALRLVHAEVQLARAAFPDRPIYVLKLDLKDYYASLPHDVLLAVLARLGLSERDLAFFHRYLDVRVRDTADGEVVTARVGIANRRRLSDLLGETIMLLLDGYVRRRARVRIVRLLDDVCLIAASPREAVVAWEAVSEFCTGCGLRLNDTKSGAVCIGGLVPPELPASQPRWQLLTLDQGGHWGVHWGVHEAAFADFLDKTRRELAATPSLIAQVHRYNAGVAYLEHTLGFALALGQSHRASVEDAVRQYHGALFGEGQGIADALRNTIGQRFVETGTASGAAVPEAWLYWPITAGGLGLRHVVLQAAAFAEQAEQRARPQVPAERREDWQRRDNGWAQLYAALTEEVQPAVPTPNQVMETLVRDFIERGAGLSAGKQRTLSPYWRWVLYLYGPQIREAFGTFRFLFSELVPLQLITEGQFGDSEAEDTP